MLTVAISKRNKLQNIIVLTPKDGCKCFCYGSAFTFAFGNCCPYETENVLESFGKR